MPDPQPVCRRLVQALRQDARELRQLSASRSGLEAIAAEIEQIAGAMSDVDERYPPDGLGAR
jgi:hypothetical protein